jgi:hypothetical protein
MPLEVVTGDCVYNAGTNDSPSIRELPCSDPKAEYKVLARINGATDGEKACANYPTYEKSVTHQQVGNDYVLCLVSNTAATPPSGT